MPSATSRPSEPVDTTSMSDDEIQKIALGPAGLPSAILYSFDSHYIALTRTTIAANATKSMTPAKLYSCETILKRLAQDLKDMAAELGQFIQEEHAIVGQRHFA